MIELLKLILPPRLRRRLRQLIKTVRYALRRLLIVIAVWRNRPMKIIVGAAETSQPGWYSTNQQWLDITCQADWNSVFGSRILLTAVVAEHVFEHLTEEECLRAMRLIHSHLQPGGRLRIAVPDGYHPDPEYIRHVGVCGIGDDASDHKQLLNVDKLTAMLAGVGFETHHIEGYNSDRQLISKPWSADHGYIRRSRQNPGSRHNWGFADAETSLIVDGIKKW